MANQTIEIQGLEILVKQIGNLKNVNDKIYFPIKDAITKSVLLLEAQIKENLTANDSVGSGLLRNSIHHGVEVSDDAIVGLVGAGAVPYAQYVEYGTGPWAGRPAYTPPLSITQPGQPLYKWVEIKHLAGVYSLKTKRRMGSKQQNIDENQKLARAVWAGIRTKGTQPHPYFLITLEQKREEIMDLFKTAVKEVVANISGNKG